MVDPKDTKTKPLSLGKGRKAKSVGNDGPAPLFMKDSEVLLPLAEEKTPVFLRSAYNYDTDIVSQETGLACLDPSLAVQSEAEDADINVIVKRFGLTGTMPEGVRLPQYGDFTGIVDYRDALAALKEADENFMQYPAHLRARFENDPQRFLEFVSNPANKQQMIDLGIEPSSPTAPIPSTDAPQAP